MNYPIVKADKAREWWFAWRNDCIQSKERTQPPEFIHTEEREGSGPSEFLEKVVETIKAVSDMYDQVDRGTAESTTNRFEAEASVVMHRDIPESEALGDPEFWTWCAVAAGAELISRRYPLSAREKEMLLSPEGLLEDDQSTLEERGKNLSWIPGKANFFSASARESLFYRLWIRGRLGRFDYEEDPYALARCGDVDFWRSHIFRQQSLEVDALRAEFIRFQFPNGAEGSPRLSQAEIRALIKRMRRATANVVADGFDREEARRFIERQWEHLDG